MTDDPEPSGTSAVRRPVLRVLVAPGCASCATAVQLAGRLRLARPSQPVEVVDLSERPGVAPPEVVGTPAYLLGDRIVSLGNPAFDTLLHLVDDAARGVDHAARAADGTAGEGDGATRAQVDDAAGAADGIARSPADPSTSTSQAATETNDRPQPRGTPTTERNLYR